ncbi:hypothetical protein [Acinetobacter baumannii]|uniref:hypothetical protein n=1 Tax=Acinetobacter baumannii TaxID=470 RepID=UPI0037BE45DD
MKKKNLFVLILFFAGCAEKEVHALSNSNLPSNQLDGVHLGDKFDDIFNKNNIIVQNYKDISNVKDCEKSKNLIIKDNQTNIDVDERGMVTAINTTNPNAIDANGISVGENEKQLFKLKNITKTKKWMRKKEVVIMNIKFSRSTLIFIIFTLQITKVK